MRWSVRAKNDVPVKGLSSDYRMMYTLKMGCNILFTLIGSRRLEHRGVRGLIRKRLLIMESGATNR